MAWPIPKFEYATRVNITPLEDVPGRVVDLHVFGQMLTVEYDVRYFHDGREMKGRFFEDELTPVEPD